MSRSRTTPEGGVTIPDDIADLLELLRGWPMARWHLAVAAWQRPSHRERRHVSRALCEAILEDRRAGLQRWLVRDATRTIATAVACDQHGITPSAVYELLEDAALALLARPSLPLLDLAILMAPCLPLASRGLI